jgi:hypothetical protein
MAAAAETAESHESDDDEPSGNPASEPKYTSLTDPAAAWTNKGQMKALFAYATNYLIDTDHAVILGQLFNDHSQLIVNHCSIPIGRSAAKAARFGPTILTALCRI